MTTSVTAPVRKAITVPAAPARAFEIFTARIGEWWSPDHHIAPEPFETVVLEPHSGGRWYERSASGAECTWGYVIAWEPPTRLVLAWQLNADFAFDADLVTEVELRFIAVDGSSTRVELEHRDLDRYGDAAEKTRTALDSGGGWTLLLDRFAEHVRA